MIRIMIQKSTVTKKKAIKEKPKTAREIWEDGLIEMIKENGKEDTLLSKKWRIANLYKIIDKEGDTVVFKRNRVQTHFEKHKAYRNLILKARQHGVSTDEVVSALDDALFIPNQNNMIIAHTVPAATKLFAKIDFAWNHLPAFIKNMVYLKSRTSAGMEIGFDKIEGVPLSQQPGRVTSSITVDTSGMSGTLTRCHITELPYLDLKFPEKAAEIVKGTLPAIPTSGRCDIEGTGRGPIGMFYSMYKKATKNPKSNKQFKAHFYNWQWDDAELGKITPEQIKWVVDGNGDQWTRFKEYQDKFKLSDTEITCYYFFWDALNQDWDMLRSEYPTTVEEAFSSGIETVFSADALMEQITSPGRKQGIWEIFKDPVAGHAYVIGGDPSEGIGRDGSAASVIDCSTNEIVAVAWDKNTPPDILGYEMAQMGHVYNRAYLVPERNSYGVATLIKLRDIYPEHLIHKERRNDKRNAHNTQRYGWFTGANKPKMVYDFATAVRMEQVIINSAQLVEELLNYPKEEISADKRHSKKLGEGGVNGSHYDIAMATFIAWQCREFALQYCSVAKTGNRLKDMLEKKKALVRKY